MRSLWKGAISFGMINIPVRLYKASQSRELKFKLLHEKDFSEIRYARMCKADGKEVPWEEIVKGYEDKEGNYVVLTDEDFERANVKKNRMIELLEFTDESAIDTIFYETPYYLEPEKGAGKAYDLLREALQRSKKVALGYFVLRNHQHLGVIKPFEDLLILNQLRYVSELINPKDLNIPKQSINKKEIDVAMQLIEQLTKPFEPSRFFDSYTEEIKTIIRKKAKGQKIPVQKQEVLKSPKVHDIMDLLKKSLEQEKKKTKRQKTA